MTRFWKNRATRTLDGVLRTEVSKAYKTVESYIGSLYSKNPAVRVEPDLRDRGNPAIAQASANQYLLGIREQIEGATRLALIYPCSFLKLSPVENVDPLKRVACSALPPWEVIVDATAGAWDQQRCVGHVFLMPVSEAVGRYSKPREQFRSRVYSKWIESGTSLGTDQLQPDNLQTPDSDQWIRVVEMYDLLDDKLLVWSADYANGDEFLFTGVTVQVGALPDEAGAGEEAPPPELVHETTGIPFKSASGRPVVPIIPLYFSRDPDTPLRGYSLIGRLADQFRELNVMRTYQAQGVRRMARQWMVRAGFLSEESAASKIAQGVDGEFIEVDLAAGDAHRRQHHPPCRSTPIPADILSYAATDRGKTFNEGGTLGPLHPRRSATGSRPRPNSNCWQCVHKLGEISRMARIRDAAITSIASNLQRHSLRQCSGDDAEPLALPNPIGPTILSADDLTGDFQLLGRGLRHDADERLHEAAELGEARRPCSFSLAPTLGSSSRRWCARSSSRPTWLKCWSRLRRARRPPSQGLRPLAFPKEPSDVSHDRCVQHASRPRRRRWRRRCCRR
jgi:hypothetical protein